MQREAATWTALGVAFLGWVIVTQTGVDIAALIDTLLSYKHLTSDIQIVGAVVLVTAAAQITGFDRYLWHMAANVTAFEKPRALTRIWVIDGDTIDGDGERYRLANVDAPERGDNAKCFPEHERGQQATKAAIELVRGAKAVSVRRTWRIDRFGRRIAFVLVDGEDLGRLLMARGLARPWRGRRERWCGAQGGLAKIARSGAKAHDCGTCRDWR
jgi:endonuclease YncB( thermonuclease family)